MRKILWLVLVTILLAAGCNSGSTQNQLQSQAPAPSSSQSTQIAPAPKPAASNSWTGTLKASDNSAKGNYLMMVGGHAIYIHTSRDYGALIGQQVNISYQGTTDNFVLGDITAAGNVTEPK